MADNNATFAASAVTCMMGHLRWLVLGLACLCTPAVAGNAVTLTFKPAAPTSRDRIGVTLDEPTCGPSISYAVVGALVKITSVDSACGTPPPATTTSIGPLPAGNYQVQWFISPSQTPQASAPLIVAAAVDSSPMLRPWALLLLTFICGVFALASFRRNR